MLDTDAVHHLGLRSFTFAAYGVCGYDGIIDVCDCDECDADGQFKSVKVSLHMLSQLHDLC